MQLWRQMTGRSMSVQLTPGTLYHPAINNKSQVQPVSWNQQSLSTATAAGAIGAVFSYNAINTYIRLGQCYTPAGDAGIVDRLTGILRTTNLRTAGNLRTANLQTYLLYWNVTRQLKIHVFT